LTGDDLKILRTSCGMSQNEFAQKLYVTRQAVSKWEHGAVKISDEYETLINEAFGLKAGEEAGIIEKAKQSNGNDVLAEQLEQMKIEFSRANDLKELEIKKRHKTIITVALIFAVLILICFILLFCVNWYTPGKYDEDVILVTQIVDGNQENIN